MVLTVSTVGALTTWGTGQSLFTVWCAFWRCSDSARTVHVCRRPLKSTVVLGAVALLGAPDSPRAALQKPEGEELESIALVYRTLSGAPDQGSLRLLLLLSFEP
jgi:hypothetical protein